MTVLILQCTSVSSASQCRGVLSTYPYPHFVSRWGLFQHPSRTCSGGLWFRLQLPWTLFGFNLRCRQFLQVIYIENYPCKKMNSQRYTRHLLTRKSYMYIYIYIYIRLGPINGTLLKVHQNLRLSLYQFPPVGSGTPAFRLGSRIDPHRHRGVVKVHWRVPWVGGLFSWVVATLTL